MAQHRARNTEPSTRPGTSESKSDDGMFDLVFSSSRDRMPGQSYEPRRGQGLPLPPVCQGGPAIMESKSNEVISPVNSSHSGGTTLPEDQVDASEEDKNAALDFILDHLIQYPDVWSSAGGPNAHFHEILASREHERQLVSQDRQIQGPNPLAPNTPSNASSSDSIMTVRPSDSVSMLTNDGSSRSFGMKPEQQDLLASTPTASVIEPVRSDSPEIDHTQHPAFRSAREGEKSLSESSGDTSDNDWTEEFRKSPLYPKQRNPVHQSAAEIELMPLNVNKAKQNPVKSPKRSKGASEEGSASDHTYQGSLTNEQVSSLLRDTRESKKSKKTSDEVDLTTVTPKFSTEDFSKITPPGKGNREYDRSNTFTTPRFTPLKTTPTPTKRGLLDTLKLSITTPRSAKSSSNPTAISLPTSIITSPSVPAVLSPATQYFQQSPPQLGRSSAPDDLKIPRKPVPFNTQPFPASHDNARQDTFRRTPLTGSFYTLGFLPSPQSLMSPNKPVDEATKEGFRKQKVSTKQATFHRCSTWPNISCSLPRSARRPVLRPITMMPSNPH